MDPKRLSPSRRGFLQGLAALAGGAASSSLLSAEALATGAEDPRFLIVLCATGGASIVDGPLAVRASECANAARLAVLPDAAVTGFDGSPLRAVDSSGSRLGAIPTAWSANQSDFVAAHRADMLVATGTGTSVNHAIAQKRSVTGNEAWRGRTLQELVAWHYGVDAPLPNVHLLTGVGQTEPGTDGSLPPWTRGEIVADPITWPLALHASEGTHRPLSPELLKVARRHRDEVFDPGSRFATYHGASELLEHWRTIRGAPARNLEAADLIRKLMVLPDSPEVPLSNRDLASSPDLPKLLETFPQLGRDPLDAQAALAFLLLKYRVSVTVTLGPTFDTVIAGSLSGGSIPEDDFFNPPIAFDYSHNDHRGAQAYMWSRIYRAADGLIRLLKAEDWGDGTSLWDRTMIVVATEFGRTRTRPTNAPSWASGHDLNNGTLVVSPLVKGDRVLGGVDPDTLLTYGYDPVTGDPEPETVMAEDTLFAGLLDALGVDTSGSGLPAVPAVRGG